jgi:hypothetical protein
VAKIHMRRQSRADVARALRDLSILFARPPDPGREGAARVGTKAARKTITSHRQSITAKRGSA